MVFDATVGRTSRGCEVTGRSVQNWTGGNQSPWVLHTTCGDVDAGDEQTWTAHAPGSTHDLVLYRLPFDHAPSLRPVLTL